MACFTASRKLLPTRHWLTALGLACALNAIASPAAKPATPSANPTPTAWTTLQDHAWRLVQMPAADAPLLAPFRADPPTMRFWPRDLANQGDLSVDKLCNGASLGIAISGQDLKPIQGKFAHTAKLCTEPLGIGTLEQRIQNQLYQIRSYSLQLQPKPQLRLHFHDGSAWVLEGSLTLAARFGPAKPMMVELASDSVPCAKHEGEAGRCFRVRELDSTTGQNCPPPIGPWQVQKHPIQGFGADQMDKGHPWILNIDRYTDPEAPAHKRHVDVMTHALSPMPSDASASFGEAGMAFVVNNPCRWKAPS